MDRWDVGCGRDGPGLLLPAVGRAGGGAGSPRRFAHASAPERDGVAAVFRCGWHYQLRYMFGSQPAQMWKRPIVDEIAVPVLTGAEPLTADTATAIRLAALCLAHEPHAREITDPYLRIVVGITVSKRTP